MKFKGRGVTGNPTNRFESISYEPDEEIDPFAEPRPKTQLLRDRAKSALVKNDSPDIGFEVSLNPYRGCEHGCAYCYARPTHEYLGFSPGLDFETKLLVKEDAPELLRRELAAKSWVPKPIALSGVTDAYQPVERTLGLTRRCLEVLVEFRNPVIVITKNFLVTRDLDLFSELARYQAVKIFLSVTTLDAELCGVLEPRTSRPAKRLEAVRRFAEAGVPVGVMMAPVIPGLTEHEIPAVLKAAMEAGAAEAGYVPLRLPFAVKDLFSEWLTRHRPEAREKILGRIREIRGGKLNDSNFNSRMTGEGVFARQLTMLFHLHCRRLGLNQKRIPVSTAAFRRPPQRGEQIGLFES